MNTSFDLNAQSRANLPQVGFNKSSVFSGFPNQAITQAERDPKAYFPFFGPPEDNSYLLNQDTTFKRNYQYPYAYPSKHLPYVSTTIIGLTINTSDFLVKEPYGCPVERTTDQVFEWNELIFDEGTLDYVPEEGIPTILRSAETSQKATVQRRGKAILVEHGFVYTPKGQQHFVRQVQQISNAIALTMSESTLKAMIRTRPKQMKYLADTGHFAKPQREILRHYYDRFAPCQRADKGVDNAIYDAIAILRDRGYSPNMIIVPTGGECFFNLTPDDYAQYQFAGPDAIIPSKSDPYARVNSKNGLAVLYTRSYKTNGRAGAPLVDPLIRHRVFGEYFKMFQAPYSICKPSEYRSYMRDIDVFDWGIDRWGTISLKQAIEAWAGYDANGFVLGANPGERFLRISGPAVNQSKPMDNLFGTVDQQGWRVAQCLGEVAKDFYSTELLFNQVEQLVPENDQNVVNSRIEALAQYSLFAGLDADTIYQAVDAITGAPENAMEVFSNRTGFRPMNAGGVVPRFVNRRTDGYDDKLEDLRRAGNANLIAQDMTVKGSSSGVSFGYLLMPEKTTVTEASNLNIDQLHQSNIELLNKLGVAPETISKYNNARQLKELDQDGFVQRTNEILSSGDMTRLSDTFVQPLESLSNKKDLKRASDLIQTLCTPTKSIQANISTSTAPATSTVSKSVLGFYPVSENFKPVSPLTGESIDTPFNFDLSKPEGIKGLVAALKASNKNLIGAPLTALTTRTDPPANFDVDAFVLSERLRSLKARYLAAGQAMDNANAQITTRKFVAGLVLLFSYLHRDAFKKIVDLDVYFPFNFLIARNWFTTQTSTGICGKGGRSLGINVVNNEDTMLGDDANTKMHIVTFTMNHATVIFNPLQLTLLEDLWVRAYTGGGNLTPFTVQQLKTMKDNQWRAGTSYDRASWLPIMVPIGQDVNDIIDIRGHFDGETSAPRHFITSQNHYSFFESVTPDNNPLGSTGTTTNSFNSAMVQGTQMCYNHQSHQNDSVIMGINHPLGPNIYTGCKKDLERCARPLKNQKYEQRPAYKYVV